MSWSASQLRMLRAMGHEPMAWQDPRIAVSGSSAPAGVSASAAASAAVSAPVSSAVAEAAAPKFAALLKALRLAAGDRDVSSLTPDLERLRREPALKRALWPALRTLRRSH